MAIDEFLISLFDNGRVRVTPPRVEEARALAAGASDAANKTIQVLADCGTALAAEFPGEPPEFNPQAAFWGANVVYRSAQLAVYRGLGAEAVAAALSDPPPPNDRPETVWSVDVTLRFLPDLYRLAAGLATDDPLAVELMALAGRWPLSSVGLKNVEVDTTKHTWLDHDGLRRLYVDRVIAARDRPRCQDPRVAAAVREAVGAFPELAPEMAEEGSRV